MQLARLLGRCLGLAQGASTADPPDLRLSDRGPMSFRAWVT